MMNRRSQANIPLRNFLDGCSSFRERDDDEQRGVCLAGRVVDRHTTVTDKP